MNGSIRVSFRTHLRSPLRRSDGLLSDLGVRANHHRRGSVGCQLMESRLGRNSVIDSFHGSQQINFEAGQITEDLLKVVDTFLCGVDV